MLCEGGIYLVSYLWEAYVELTSTWKRYTQSSKKVWEQLTTVVLVVAVDLFRSLGVVG